MIRVTDVTLLRCPSCRSSLSYDGTLDGELLERGTLRCEDCRSPWPVRRGWPRLYREGDVAGTDRLMRVVYDAFAVFHDPAVRYLLPLMHFCTEQRFRDGYMPRLELDRLAPRDDGQPLRILEVGFGGGANLPLLRRDLPAGLALEIWGLDLSRGMLRVGQRKVRRQGADDVRLLLADAHALPFADHVFDRVFHVGASGNYRDPALALAEMARVARPGSPIVVVDEQLDRSRANTLYHRAAFKLLTWYDPDPHCPSELVPPGAHDVVSEQVSSMYYCLTFRWRDHKA